jgi:hypothetical protein
MTTNWDKTKPSSVEFVSNWPTEATNNWGALEDALGREHTFPGDQGTTAGQHRAATESVTGTARFATVAEVAAGTDDTIAVSPLGLQTGLAGTGQTRYGKLKIYNNAGTPASKIDITASSLLLTDGGTPAVPFRVTTVSLTIDGTVTGANGLDTGSLSVGWYYVYAIAYVDNSSVIHVAGIISTSYTAPILPTNYVYYGLFGAVYYYQDSISSSYQFRKVLQYANKVYYVGPLLPTPTSSPTTNPDAILFTASSSSYASASIAAYIPHNAIVLYMQPFTTLTTGPNLGLAIAWDNSGTNELIFISVYTSPIDNVIASLPPCSYAVNPSAPQTVYVKNGGSASQAWLKGYELDI